jgi:cbb3-type cytochrome oxidase maturation protein
MDILFLLLPLSFILVTIIVGCAVWAVQSRQFEDLSSPATRILSDDDEKQSLIDSNTKQS